MTEKMMKLLKAMEDVRTDMETMLEDETIASLPKAYKRMRDNFDTIIIDVESGAYEEEE